MRCLTSRQPDEGDPNYNIDRDFFALYAEGLKGVCPEEEEEKLIVYEPYPPLPPSD